MRRIVKWVIAEVKERWPMIKAGARAVIARDTPHRWRVVAMFALLLMIVPVPGPIDEIAALALLGVVGKKVKSLAKES